MMNKLQDGEKGLEISKAMLATTTTNPNGYSLQPTVQLFVVNLMPKNCVKWLIIFKLRRCDLVLSFSASDSEGDVEENEHSAATRLSQQVKVPPGHTEKAGGCIGKGEEQCLVDAVHTDNETVFTKLSFYLFKQKYNCATVSSGEDWNEELRELVVGFFPPGSRVHSKK